MFKGIGKFFAKTLLPLIAANLDLDIDTVQKETGVYLRIRVEVFGSFTLLDRLVKITESAKELPQPVDIFIAPEIENALRGVSGKIDEKLLNTMKNKGMLQ